MDKPSDLLDRDAAWDRLVRAVQRPAPGLLLVLGRRRAGKSYLLTRFVRQVGGLYYQATKKTEREQLSALSRALGEALDDAALQRATLPDWDALLEYVVARAAGKPFVLVLDEFPYLAEATPALPSILQHWWDHRLADTRVVLVLSGSHVTAMKRLVEVDQPLYGRRTDRIDVRPFDYLDAARFVPSWSARDKLRLYALFGGLPGHLALVNEARSLAHNAAYHLLDGAGRLHDEAIRAFDAFLADAAVPYSIIEAIAGGEQQWSRISSRVGKQTSALARPLDWLIDMEVVERVAPLTEYPNPNPKRTLYRLTDPYLVFWHRFVADIKARGLSAFVEPDTLWERLVAPRIDEYAGSVFEEACRQFAARGTHPSLPFKPLVVGSWWNADASAQVDVVALDGQGGLLVGECKWGTVGARDLDRLRQRSALIASELGGVTRTTYALFSARGLEGDEAARRIAAGEALHVPIEALYYTG